MTRTIINGNFKEKEKKNNYLSAIEPTTVPKRRLEPKPATNSSSISCFVIPYASYKA